MKKKFLFLRDFLEKKKDSIWIWESQDLKPQVALSKETIFDTGYLKNKLVLNILMLFLSFLSILFFLKKTR